MPPVSVGRATLRSHRPPLLATAAVLALSDPVGAQSRDGGDPDARAAVMACLDSIPDGAFTRVPVYLLPAVGDSAHVVILPGADILADVVARHVRGRLGAAAATLPMGEPAVSWRDVDVDVVVTVRRDGDFSWRASDEQSMLRPAGQQSPAATLLTDALGAAHDAGERLPWPAGATDDSLEFRLGLSHAAPSRAGALVAERRRVSIPVFSLAVPWTTPVSVVRPPRIAYPEKLAQTGVTGTIILQYMVSADGRADQSTLRDIWNSPERYPRGERGHAYRTFIAAVKRALPAARFEPALAGGCAVPHVVQQPFVFGIRDG